MGVGRQHGRKDQSNGRVNRSCLPSKSEFELHGFVVGGGDSGDIGVAACVRVCPCVCGVRVCVAGERGVGGQASGGNMAERIRATVE